MPRPSPSHLLSCFASLALLLFTAAPAAAQVPDDPVFLQGLQWGLAKVGAPEAWDHGTGEGITIAVVDSGVDMRHEDLRSQIAGGISCIGSAGDPRRCTGSAQDDNGHGTHVAGIALAAMGNGTGVAGIAPGADLLAVRVLANECSAAGCTASGTASDVAAGIRWATDNGADVINLSLGGGALQSALGCAFCDAVEYAWANGAVPVIAAGNDSLLPAGFGEEHAVVVTATTRHDQRASYSAASSSILRRARWPVSAPGGEGETDPRDCGTGGTPQGILSTYWSPGQHDEYACLAGTSMAAPHVSGALAVLLGMGLGPQQAIDRLLGTATDLGAPGRDAAFGVGRIDVARAVGPGPATSTTPTTVASSSTTGSTVTAGTASTAPVQLAPPTTAPASTPAPTTAPPPVVLPGTEQAAPFQGAGDDTEEPPTWLVLVAVAAVLLSGGATTAAATRR